jgi:hypothetical protein
MIEANQQLSVWLEPLLQDLRRLLCFACEDALRTEEAEGNNVKFAIAVPRAGEGRLRHRRL